MREGKEVIEGRNSLESNRNTIEVASFRGKSTDERPMSQQEINLFDENKNFAILVQNAEVDVPNITELPNANDPFVISEHYKKVGIEKQTKQIMSRLTNRDIESGFKSTIGSNRPSVEQHYPQIYGRMNESMAMMYDKQKPQLYHRGGKIRS